jgi:hypothetical protein
MAQQQSHLLLDVKSRNEQLLSMNVIMQVLQYPSPPHITFYTLM